MSGEWAMNRFAAGDGSQPRCAEIVLVFAKLPEAGTAKSRIAASVGRARANAIYEELLTATARTVSTFPHCVAYADGEEPGSLRSLFPEAVGFFPQSGNGLGERLRHAVKAVQSEGWSRVCTIGCDCPSLKQSHLREVFALLAGGAEVVLGPAEDGGYYLVGCTSPGIAVFEATLWSTDGLFRETMRIVADRGLRCSLLETLSDIDTIKDYQRWKSRSDLPDS